LVLLLLFLVEVRKTLGRTLCDIEITLFIL
jgi:hypothetical protein